MFSTQWNCITFGSKFKFIKSQCQTRIKIWSEASRLLNSAPDAPFARAGVVPYMAVGEVRLKGVCELLRIIGVPARASLGGRPMPEESSSPASTNTKEQTFRKSISSAFPSRVPDGEKSENKSRWTWSAVLCKKDFVSRSTAFGIHNRKLGKKDPGQNNPEKGENEKARGH